MHDTADFDSCFMLPSPTLQTPTSRKNPESRLNPGDIEKVLLVGGPTLMPYLRQRLTDKTQGLGITLEFSRDPFTVVAQGAAVFAATQPLVIVGLPPAGEYNVNLDYKAIGPDVEPLVSGQVVSASGEDLSKLTIEFVNKEARPPWRSGKVGLSPDGRFMTNLWAEKGRQNTFIIELVSATGVRQVTKPESFPYTVGGGVISNQPLIHSIGVALADNTVAEFFKKGTPLPARCRRTMKTTVDVRAGKSGEFIRAPVVEGENRRADRNETVGNFEIHATNLKRDVPAGSELDVVIEVDDSRRFLTKAYVPLLDEEFEATLIKTLVVPKPDELDRLVQAEKKRLAGMREKARKTNEPRAMELLVRIDGERLEHEVDQALAASRNDQDSADKCASRLRDLQIALDSVDDALRWPELVAKAEDVIKLANEVVQQDGNVSDRTLLKTLVEEVREAITQHDEALLQTRQDELENFWIRIYRTTPQSVVGTFAYLEERKGLMADQAEAERLFAMGTRAMNQNDIDGLRAVNQQLRALLPPAERSKADNSLGSTVRLA
jgi:molecular chaperone DnaK